MRKILKLPVIGYLLRIMIAIVKLPKYLDEIGKQQKELLEYISSMANEKEEWKESLQGALRELDSVKNQAEQNNEDIRRNLFEQGLQKMMKTPKKMEMLNRELSIHPTIWGDQTRLHISGKSAVNSGFFNLYSGEIYIDDYTFAGSNVSILTGSHDYCLTGLLRRDLEEKEGNDIVIGKGVWLASNCTLLGPCTIGDNAVIAAGAVVTPGTVVPENTIYAGIPACEIKKICAQSMSKYNENVKNAIKREKGVLFVEGWSEKKELAENGTYHYGHWNEGNSAKLYVSVRHIRLYYYHENEDGIKVLFKKNSICKEIILDNREGEILLDYETDVEGIEEIDLEIIPNGDVLFLEYICSREEDCE